MENKDFELVFVKYEPKDLIPGILVKELTGAEIGTIRYLMRDEVALVSKKLLLENLLPVTPWIVSSSEIVYEGDKVLIMEALIGTCIEKKDTPSIKNEKELVTSYRLEMDGGIALMSTENLKKVLATPEQIEKFRNSEGILQNLTPDVIKFLKENKGKYYIEPSSNGEKVTISMLEKTL